MVHRPGLGLFAFVGEQIALVFERLRNCLLRGGLGIGAIIGTGIFVLIGTAIVGDAHRPGAGPGITLSFVLSGLTCALAALCYAEFAAMIPVAGSAYTYSYATLGEFLAWLTRDTSV